MREIKFRAWFPSEALMGKKGMLDNVHTACEGVSLNGFIKNTETVGITLMQYIGLKDKNGTEVYEGDIIEHGDPTGLYSTRLREVIEWDSDMELSHAQGSCAGFYYPETEFEIIGNIYENPELLDNKQPAMV